MNIGYCCINLSLNRDKSRSERVLVNRGMIKKTFDSRGLRYVSELAIKNIDDMRKIIEWNLSNDILVYRMSSDIFPCLGFYNLSDLPDFKLISFKLKSIGDFSKLNKVRLSFHPSHFCIIASDKQSVVDNAIDELNKHAEIMDIMGLDQSRFYPINIHIGTTKPNREEAAIRFIENFSKLSEFCQSRLVLENDDSPNQFSVKMLYDLIYTKIGVPITLDFHHFRYGLQDQKLSEAVKLAHSTWSVRPLFHISSPRSLETPGSKDTAHADYIYESINTFELDFDVEIEAKAKDLAVLDYRSKFC